MLFDGIDYVVQHETPFAGNPERVLVWAGDESLVATAIIDHNMEQIHVDYEGFGLESASYNYFEYSDPEELASWMVATSY